MTPHPAMPDTQTFDFGDTTDFSALLLRLYGLSQQLPLEAFHEAALALIKPVVPFDTAVWGCGTLGTAGVDIHGMHLHRTSTEMMQRYAEHMAHDEAAQAVGRLRNFTGMYHTPTFVADPGLRDFTRRHGLLHAYVSGSTHPDTGYTQWLSLYREEVDAHCQETQRQWLQLLRPHLMQALAMNRKLHLGRLAAAAPGPQRAVAVADLRGVVLHADARFEALMRSEWEGWRMGALAPALIQQLQAGSRGFTGRAVVVRCQVQQQLLFLRARARCPADALSARELQVARLFAHGHTHKQVAQQLVRAPATVRNHLQAIYAKLEVSNVAGLIAALREADAF